MMNIETYLVRKFPAHWAGDTAAGQQYDESGLYCILWIHRGDQETAIIGQHATPEYMRLTGQGNGMS
ncbi:hypothetical protein [Salmonella enterica]|uniref:hypothetical protein n=1 Tax=Salmonella enterica TaxID=28901 RepID=UPI0013B3B70D|nr:hypothetical protein [Salmonella enterica]